MTSLMRRDHRKPFSTFFYYSAFERKNEKHRRKLYLEIQRRLGEGRGPTSCFMRCALLASTMRLLSPTELEALEAMTLRLLRIRCRLRPPHDICRNPCPLPRRPSACPSLLPEAPALFPVMPVFSQDEHLRTFPSRLWQAPASWQRPRGSIHALTKLRRPGNIGPSGCRAHP